jgi:hypothetical protein
VDEKPAWVYSQAGEFWAFAGVTSETAMET